MAAKLTAKPGDANYWDDWEGPEMIIPGEEGPGYRSFGKLRPEALAEVIKEWGPKVRYPPDSFMYPREKYALEKVYVRQKAASMFGKAKFVVCFQHDLDVKGIKDFKQGLETKSEGRIVVKTVLKNSLHRLALVKDNDGKLAGLAPLLNGPTGIAVGLCEENMLADLNMVLKGRNNDILYIGGMVDGEVIDHNQLNLLEGVESKMVIRSHLINALQQPSHNLVRALKNPLDGLVKTLEFSAKGHDAEGAEAGDGDKTGA